MTEKLTDDQIAAIRDGCEGVTPGPWAAHGTRIGTPDYKSFIGDCRDEHADWMGERHEKRLAAHIARCDPHTIRALATEVLESRATIEALEARIEVLEAENARLNKMPVNRDYASLHNETQRLREALERISLHGMMNEPKTVGVIVNMQDIARTALGGNDDTR